MEPFEFGGSIVWRPSPDVMARTRLRRFMGEHGVESLDELARRSTTDLEWFWNAVLRDLDIRFYSPYTRVLDTSRGIAWTRWCIDGRMNIVHNCLDKWMGTPAEQRTAVRWEGEEGATRVLSYGELWREANRAANALGALGFRQGDVAGIFMPMCPEIVVAFFAVMKVGGIVLPLFSGYGPDAAATRLADAGARLLITADGFYRRGEKILTKPLADEAVRGLDTIAHVLVVRRLNAAVPWVPGRDRWWHDLVDGQSADAPTEQTGADDPLMILYTSGTTGRPKGAVHTHCGFPIKAAQDMAHCFDIQDTDTMYWVTDMGWMMGPWEVVGMTLLGGTMVLYDGAMDFPGPDRLWAMVERHKVTSLGVSPTLIRALMRHGPEPVERHDVSSLRMFGSTGEPWNPEPWRWLFETVGRSQRPIINYSGGTEVSGGLVCGNFLTPLKPCAFAGPPPGIAADVVDDQGRSIRNQVGELVVRQPWIGMTRGFWKDPDRYFNTYWSRFPDVWVHGDWAAIDEDGLWYILGRSDDTIKVAGKRLGPAEVESVLVEHPAVSEAAAIGVPDETKGQALVCFCVLKVGHEAGDALRETLKSYVAARLGKPLKPSSLEFVGDLPKTRNAKIMRRVIRAAYLHQDPGDLSSLENPQAVEDIQRVSRLRRLQ